MILKKVETIIIVVLCLIFAHFFYRAFTGQMSRELTKQWFTLFLFFCFYIAIFIIPRVLKAIVDKIPKDSFLSLENYEAKFKEVIQAKLLARLATAAVLGAIFFLMIVLDRKHGEKTFFYILKTLLSGAFLGVGLIAPLEILERIRKPSASGRLEVKLIDSVFIIIYIFVFICVMGLLLS